MSSQQAFLEANQGKLSPELAAQLLELGEGDTVTKEAETDNQPEVVATPEKDAAKEVTPVLMAKDGVHTIDYKVLADEREEKQRWKAQAEASEVAILELKTQAQQRADAGQAPTAVDNVLAAATAAGFTTEQAEELFGDFSPEAMLKAVTTIGNAQVEGRVKELDAKYESKFNELTQLVKPLAEKQAVSDTDLHFKAIYDKYPDADSIAESQELASWIASQPSFTHAGFKTVLTQGTAKEVIELFDTFKAATKPQKVDYQAAAKDAIAKVQATAPLSISDIPGGRIGAVSKYEAMASMSPVEKAAAMENMTQEQVDAYLNRSM